MKQLVKTADPTSLPTVNYDRVIYNSETDNVIIKGANDNGHPYVDLGLPSGLKWAKYNVGATSETQYGKFFQWGETTTDTNYTWAAYKYCNGSSTTMTKYCTDSLNGTVDNKTKLEDEDDAARANMGGDWRMPTQAEFQELITYTANEWVDDFDGNGTKGYKFTSKKDTSNYIFIPATERYSDISTYIQDISYNIWSSSLNTTAPRYAWALNFNSSHITAGYDFNRSDGMAVRGVL